MRQRPVPVKTDSFYELVDYEVLRNIIFNSLYSPYTTFQDVARALADLAAGDGTALLALSSPSIFQCSCDPHEHDTEQVFDGRMTLACNDGDEVPLSLDQLQEYWEKLAGVSDFADLWGSIRTLCV